MGKQSIHSLSYTYVSGSLTALTRHFFWDSLFGNFEIVFVSWLSFLRFGPFTVFCGSLSLTEKRKMCPTLPETIVLLTQ